MIFSTFVCNCGIDITKRNNLTKAEYMCTMKNYLNYAETRNFITTKKYDELLKNIETYPDVNYEIVFCDEYKDIDSASICIYNKKNIDTEILLKKMGEFHIASTLISFLKKHLIFEIHPEYDYYLEVYEQYFNKKIY